MAGPNILARPGLIGERPEIERNPYTEAQGFIGLTSPTSGDAIDAAAGQALTTNPSNLIDRFVRRQFDESPLLDPETANEKYGVEWQGRKELSWSEPVHQDTAAELRDLKLKELRRQFTMSRSPGGFLESVGTFGATLAVSIVDPLNIAAAFVPVVREARYAELLGRAGSAGARALVRAGVGATEGAVGTAALEGLVYPLARSEQADYTLADSFLNVALGGVLGGGLHSVGGAFGDRYGVSRFAQDAAEKERIELVRKEIEDASRARDARLMRDLGTAEGNRMAREIEMMREQARVPETSAAALDVGDFRARLDGTGPLPIVDMIRQQPAAAFTDDISFVRNVVAEESPEMAARIDRAQAAVVDLETRVEQVSSGVPEAIGTYAPRTASRMGIAAAAPLARQQARFLTRQLQGAREELASAVRQAQREIGLIEGPRAVANEIARISADYRRMPAPAKHALLRSAVSELLDNGQVRATGPMADAIVTRQAPPEFRMFDAQDDAGNFRQLPRDVATETAEAEAGLKAAEEALAASAVIRPVTADEAVEIAMADEQIARAETMRRAYEVATACALGRT